jgi:hypothetical protein
MGFEPTTSSLPWTCSTRLSYLGRETTENVALRPGFRGLGTIQNIELIE